MEREILSLVCMGMRERQGEKAEQDGNGAGEIELGGGLLAAQEAEGDAAADPADGGEDFHARETGLRIEQMVQRKGIAQRESGDEQRAIKNQGRVKGRELIQLRQRTEDDSAEQAEDSEDSFRSEIAVCNQADKEGRDHRADGESAVGHADFLTTEFEDIGQVRPHAHVPCAPDEVLDEHERGQGDFELRLHG